MKLGGGGGMKKLIGEDEPDGATLYACVTFSKNKTCYIENVILTGITPRPPPLQMRIRLHRAAL